jgi:hypothetical protein
MQNCLTFMLLSLSVFFLFWGFVFTYIHFLTPFLLILFCEVIFETDPVGIYFGVN